MKFATAFSAATLSALVACDPGARHVAAPRLNITPELRIEGDTLPNMSDIVVLSNGTIVVNHDADAFIRYFAGDGRQLGTFGRLQVGHSRTFAVPAVA